MNRLKSKLSETNGAISIFVVMMLILLLPMAIWVGIELPKMHEANQRAKDAVDSAASSAVTLIQSDNDAFGEGQVLLDKTSITQVSAQIVAEKMGLVWKNSRWEPKAGSSIKNDGLNQIQVTVVDDRDLVVNGARVDKSVYSKIPGKTWTKKVKRPAVIVEVKVTYEKMGWWGNDLTVNQTGMSQVILKL